MDSSNSEGSFAGGEVVAVCEAATTATATTTTTTAMALKPLKVTESLPHPNLFATLRPVNETAPTTTPLAAVTELMRQVIGLPWAQTLGLGDYARRMDRELGQPTPTLELVTFISD